MNFLSVLLEMGAPKLCDKCGKSMAANHYWYKGGWKCKQTNVAQAQAPAQTQAQAADPADQQPDPAAQQPEPQAAQQEPQAADPAAQQQVAPAAGGMQMFGLSFQIEIVAEAMPYLEKELAKINKTAAKIGADPIKVTVVDTLFKDVKGAKDDQGKPLTAPIKQKFLVIELIGSTPRIQSADGSYWEFLGVITPSSQNKAILNLVPGAGNSEGIRRMYSANPYYCDHCRKVRIRNETFIVSDGTQYRQVGRNCLKDFVGGSDPLAVLNFFSWFQDADALKKRMEAKSSSSGGGGASSLRWASYLSPVDVLAATFAAVDVKGKYVPAKAEFGVSTATEVRHAFWGWDTPTTFLPKTLVDENEEIRKKMKDPAYIKMGEDVLNWFKSLPAQEIQSNTYFQNVKVMVDEDAVETKMINYIIGLYAAWKRANPTAPQGQKVTLVKEWPQAWGQGPKPANKEHAVVKFIRYFTGSYGTSAIIYLMLDSGQGVTWKYSGKESVKEGDEFDLTGTYEQDTYFNPPRVKFVPDRKWLRSEAFKP